MESLFVGVVFYQRATDIESGLLNSTSRNVQRTETWMLGTHETLPALRHCQCSGLWYVDLDSKSDFSKRERTGFPINTQPGSADWIPTQQSALRQTRCHPVCSLVVILSSRLMFRRLQMTPDGHYFILSCRTAVEGVFSDKLNLERSSIFVILDCTRVSQRST